MTDYKEMYLMLFRKVTKAITLLQEAQISTEEHFTSSEDAPIKMLQTGCRAIDTESDENPKD